jgi:hypothetical protein
MTTISNLLDQIPPLVPPKPEIPPTFFESHQALIWGIGCLLIILGMLIVWLILRPGRPAVTLPAATARVALASLRGRPEDGMLLSQTSQILRHYFTAAFGLPDREMTTSEFTACIREEQRIEPDLATGVVGFLRSADERKFNTGVRQEPLEAVTTVSRIIDRAEARLTELGLAAATKSSSAGSTQTVQAG